jgi:hypothetical protein
MTTSGINTHVNIDLDGTGGTYSPTNIATIYNETGLDLATLITQWQFDRAYVSAITGWEPATFGAVWPTFAITGHA